MNINRKRKADAIGRLCFHKSKHQNYKQIHQQQLLLSGSSSTSIAETTSVAPKTQIDASIAISQETLILDNNKDYSNDNNKTSLSSLISVTPWTNPTTPSKVETSTTDTFPTPTSTKTTSTVTTGGRGSIVGWVSCPLCGEYSNKKFALGRGIASHLHDVHTPWKPISRKIQRQRRLQYERQKRMQQRMQQRQGIQHDQQQTEQKKEEEEQQQQQWQSSLSGWEPTVKEQVEWDEHVLDFVCELERKFFVDFETNSTNNHNNYINHNNDNNSSMSTGLSIKQNETTNSFEPEQKVVVIVNNNSDTNTNTNIKMIQPGFDRNGNPLLHSSYRDSLPPFVQAAANGDIQTLHKMIEQRIKDTQKVQSHNGNSNRCNSSHSTNSSHSCNNCINCLENNTSNINGNESNTGTCIAKANCANTSTADSNNNSTAISIDDSIVASAVQDLLDTSDRHLSTAEHWAAGGGHVDCLRYLFQIQDQILEVAEAASAAAGGAVEVEVALPLPLPASTATATDESVKEVTNNKVMYKANDGSKDGINRIHENESTTIETAKMFEDVSFDTAAGSCSNDNDHCRTKIRQNRIQNSARRRSSKRRRDGKTCLHYSARYGQLVCIKYLIHACKFLVDERSGDGTTPLHLACFGCHYNTVRYLIEECHADAFATNDWGCSVAHFVAMYKQNKQRKQQTKHQQVIATATNQSGGTRTTAGTTNNYVDDGEEKCNNPIINNREYYKVWKLCHYLHSLGISFVQRQKQGHMPLHKAAQHLNRSFIEWMMMMTTTTTTATTIKTKTTTTNTPSALPSSLSSLFFLAKDDVVAGGVSTTAAVDATITTITTTTTYPLQPLSEEPNNDGTCIVFPKNDCSERLFVPVQVLPDDGGHLPSDIWLSFGGDEAFGTCMKTQFGW